MQKHSGLTTSEHRQASNLLARAFSALRDVGRLIHQRYHGTHAIQREVQESMASVQATRVEMENAARAEHPDAKLIYLIEPPEFDPDITAHAMATPGENVGEID